MKKRGRAIWEEAAGAWHSPLRSPSSSSELAPEAGAEPSTTAEFGEDGRGLTQLGRSGLGGWQPWKSARLSVDGDDALERGISMGSLNVDEILVDSAAAPASATAVRRASAGAGLSRMNSFGLNDLSEDDGDGDGDGDGGIGDEEDDDDDDDDYLTAAKTTTTTTMATFGGALGRGHSQGPGHGRQKDRRAGEGREVSFRHQRPFLLNAQKRYLSKTDFLLDEVVRKASRTAAFVPKDEPFYLPSAIGPHPGTDLIISQNQWALALAASQQVHAEAEAEAEAEAAAAARGGSGDYADWAQRARRNLANGLNGSRHRFSGQNTHTDWILAELPATPQTPASPSPSLSPSEGESDCTMSVDSDDLSHTAPHSSHMANKSRHRDRIHADQSSSSDEDVIDILY